MSLQTTGPPAACGEGKEHRMRSKRLAGRVEAIASGAAYWTQIGQRLRIRRNQLGLAAAQVAETLGIATDDYESLESGHMQVPASMLGQLASHFDVPVVWFWQDVAFDGDSATSGESSGVFKVATIEERAQALTDCFRTLDLDGQQHLLAVAAALTRSGSEPVRE
jgi:transcriptional regulator with XRE-family HTH domain